MLGGKEEVYRSIKMSDNIKLAALSIPDQIRLIFSKLSNDDVAELDSMERLSADKLRKIAALTRLFETAISKFQEIGERSVTLEVSSEFLPFIDEVIDEEKGLGKFYEFKVYKRNISISIPHKFIVTITKR